VCAAEEVLPELARSIGAGCVYCHGEVTAEDAKVEGAVRKALDKAGAALKVGVNTVELSFILCNSALNAVQLHAKVEGAVSKALDKAGAALKVTSCVNLKDENVVTLMSAAGAVHSRH
jgi:hypothetical protein